MTSDLAPARFRRLAAARGLGLVAILLSPTAAPAEEPPYEAGSATLVVLPDTEGYVRRRPELFAAQTEWIADVARRRGVVAAIHLGDVTARNEPAEWEVARRSFDLLGGKVPFALVPGNHDYDQPERPRVLVREATRLNDHFSFEAFRKSPAFGGAYAEGRLENTFHRLRIGERDWLIVCLEFAPRPEVVAWADEVLRSHADRSAIVVTHAYLFRDNVRYDRTAGAQRASPAPWGADGEELWNGLLRRRPNVQLVLCGHVASQPAGYRADAGDAGNVVHQLLGNYEGLRDGGSGFLRLLEFLPDGRTVQVRTYSPALDATRDGEFEAFRFRLRFADDAE